MKFARLVQNFCPAKETKGVLHEDFSVFMQHPFFILLPPLRRTCRSGARDEPMEALEEQSLVDTGRTKRMHQETRTEFISSPYLRFPYTQIFPSASAVFVAATIPSINAMSAGIKVQQNKK